jgi:hypothetical protein
VIAVYREPAAAAATARPSSRLWSWLASSMGFGEKSQTWWRPAITVATLTLLIAGAWWLWSRYTKESPRLVENPPTDRATPAASERGATRDHEER